MEYIIEIIDPSVRIENIDNFRCNGKIIRCFHCKYCEFNFNEETKCNYRNRNEDVSFDSYCSKAEWREEDD